MGKFDNLIHNPTHSFDLFFSNTTTIPKVEPTVYKWNSLIVTSESIDEAAKKISEFLGFEVNSDELEELGVGVICLD